MTKVTITVETEDQTTTVTRQHDNPRAPEGSVAHLFAECIWRVADTFPAEVLEDISRAVAAARRARP